MKKQLTITVKGNHKKWSFTFYANPKYISDWEKDGLNISILENTIPELIMNLKLTKIWIFLQDLFNFKIFRR